MKVVGALEVGMAVVATAVIVVVGWVIFKLIEWYKERNL